MLFVFLVVSGTHLVDCYSNRLRPKNKFFIDKKNEEKASSESEYETDDEYKTCGHPENSFTPPILSDKSKQRIDFIMFKFLNPSCPEYKSRNSRENGFVPHSNCSCNDMCIVERMQCSSKDQSGMSFSDHQTVAAKITMSFANSNLNMLCDANGKVSNEALFDIGGDRLESKESKHLALNSPQVLSTFPISIDIKTCKRPLQLMNSIKRNLNSCVTSSEPIPVQLLANTKSLLQRYAKDAKQIKNEFVITYFIATILTLILSMVLIWFDYVHTTSILYIWTIFFLVSFVALLLNDLSSRCEHNAIHAVIKEITQDLNFSKDISSTKGSC